MRSCPGLFASSSLAWSSAGAVLVLGSLAGCGSDGVNVLGVDSGAPDSGLHDSGKIDSGESDSGTSPSPPPEDGGAACAFSYECANGTYCNLHQCTQDCNTTKSCRGGLVCTPRGECATSASAPADPAPTPAAGVLASAESTITVKSTDTSFVLDLTGKGPVSYRLSSSASWVVPPAALGSFTGSAAIPFKVFPSKASLGAPDAVVHVYSTEGDLDVLVSTKPGLQGVWQGSITFSSVNLGASGGATSVPSALGQVQLGLDIRTDAPGLRAQIDSSNSTLWAAPASGPASGTGTTNADGTTTFTLSELVDANAAASLYDASSPSVFGAAPIGRQLALTVSVGNDGSLSGAVAETIFGLTSTPVEIDGTVKLHPSTTATLATFAAPSAMTMPVGPARGVGATPSSCTTASLVDSSCGGSTGDQKWTCITGVAGSVSGWLELGFPLDPFYLGNPDGGGGFAVPASGSTTTSVYTTAAQACNTALGGSYRTLSSPADGNQGCADLVAIDCARALSGNTLGTSYPDLATQGALYAARAYEELFELMGNQSALDSVNDRLGATTETNQLKTDLLLARTGYDAGLFWVFSPPLFEELRAASATLAQAGPLTKVNDRIPLRRAAEVLARSAQMTSHALQLDFGSSTNVTALHTSAQADATLYWLETALLADLEARWRGGVPTPLPEVAALGPAITAYDQQIQGLAPGYTPLGVPSAYVPLLANSASGPGTTTNYERLYASAETTVTASVAADQAAAQAVASYDATVTAANNAIANDMTTQIQTIQAICGDSFIVGGVPNTDLTQCGATTGSVNAALVAIQGANLNLLAAQQALQAQYQDYADESAAFALINNVNVNEIAFVDSSNKTIFDLSIAQAAVTAAADVAAGVGSALGAAVAVPPNPVAAGFDAAAGALNAAAALITPFIGQQQALQQSDELEAGAMITQIQNALTLQQTALQFAGLQTQVAIAVNQIGSSASTLGTLMQQVQDASAAFQADVAAQSRSIDSDPSFAVLEQTEAVAADQALATAKLDLYYAGRGLEYETNTQLPSILTSIYSALNAAQLSSLSSCLASAWEQWQLLVSSGNVYVTNVSLAKDVLGITGTVTDPETHQLVSAGDQFRHFLFAQPYTPDAAHVWPAIQFGTTLADTNSLFSSLVCDDRITGIAAQLVGTGLSGTTAELQVLVNGVSTLRSCAATATRDVIVPWNLRPSGSLAPAVIETGVNVFPAGVAPNQSLYDYGVAQSQWIVAIPDAQTSPANASIDVTKIDDIILQISHTGQAVGSATTGFNPTCN